METEPLPTAEEKPHRLRWYQWRLRSMFIITLLAAIGMSYVAVVMQDGKRQKAAAEAIEKAGGRARCEPTWLGKLLHDVTLVNVTAVDLFGANVTDVDLGHLEELAQLRFLCLSKTTTTDTGLANIERLRYLQCLYLSNTQVSDAGLAHLQGLSRLKWLYLDDTTITDAGLTHLQPLNQLEALTLDRTKVTAQGVKRLRQALPHCTISR